MTHQCARHLNCCECVVIIVRSDLAKLWLFGRVEGSSYLISNYAIASSCPARLFSADKYVANAKLLSCSTRRSLSSGPQFCRFMFLQVFSRLLSFKQVSNVYCRGSGGSLGFSDQSRCNVEVVLCLCILRLHSIIFVLHPPKNLKAICAD